MDTYWATTISNKTGDILSCTAALNLEGVDGYNSGAHSYLLSHVGIKRVSLDLLAIKYNIKRGEIHNFISDYDMQ